MADFDNSVLSGNKQQDATGDFGAPLSGNNPDAPDLGAPALPALDASGLGGPQSGPTPPTAPAAAPMGSQVNPAPTPQQPVPVWRRMLAGALYGLGNSGGATNFGEGLGRGAEGVLKQKQQEVENQQRAQQLQMESVRAADSHIAALDEHTRINQLTANGKLEYKQHQAEYQEFLQDHFGIEPNLSFNDSSTEATAGLQTLANQNGGTIPPVATSQQPEDHGTHGTISAYSPSQQQMRQNVAGFRNLINTQRAVTGQPAIDDPTFNSLGFKGQRDAALAAITFMSPTPAYNLDKNSPAYLPNVLAQKTQQLQQYQNHKDVNGNKDADPNVIQQLHNGITYLQKSWDTSNQMENTAAVANINATAPAKAAAAAQETTAKAAAELNTPQGRAAYAKTQQETINAKYKNAEDHQKALFNEGVDPVTGERLNLANAPDEALIDGNTGKPIPTKMLSTLKPTQQESNRADFARSALHSLDIIDQLKASGKLPNGPIQGWTTKGLEKVGLNSKDAADAIGLIALTQSAATGAHVGGRFSAQIMDKMNGLLTLNSNDQQFAGQELALRQVMQPYAQQGGRETVAQYKNEIIGTVQTLKNGQKINVTGLDKNGNFTGTQVK